MNGARGRKVVAAEGSDRNAIETTLARLRMRIFHFRQTNFSKQARSKIPAAPLKILAYLLQKPEVEKRL